MHKVSLLLLPGRPSVGAGFGATLLLVLLLLLCDESLQLISTEVTKKRHDGITLVWHQLWLLLLLLLLLLLSAARLLLLLLLLMLLQGHSMQCSL